MNVAVSDLRRQPQFRDAIADRVWRAWWRERGTPLGELTAWVDSSLSADALPLMLVAHDGADFAGAASVIASDLAERPQLTPWVATVWVEPDFRGRGIGRALVAQAAAAAFALGFETLYLCAGSTCTISMRGRAGWRASTASGNGGSRCSACTRGAPSPEGIRDDPLRGLDSLPARCCFAMMSAGIITSRYWWPTC